MSEGLKTVENLNTILSEFVDSQLFQMVEYQNDRREATVESQSQRNEMCEYECEVNHGEAKYKAI